MGLELHSLTVAPQTTSVEAPAPQAFVEVPLALEGWCWGGPAGELVADWGQVAPFEAQQAQAEMVVAFARSGPGVYEDLEFLPPGEGETDAFAQLFDVARDARVPSCDDEGAPCNFADGVRFIRPGLAAVVRQGHPLSPGAPEGALARALLRTPSRGTAAARLSSALDLLARPPVSSR